MKQVIVMRKDLKMRKGKMIAQGAHASMAVFFNRIVLKDENHIIVNVNPVEHEWIEGSFTKVCVGVNSEDELIGLYASALTRGMRIGTNLPCALITDIGKTEFNGVPTKTCFAIGPAEDELIDEITGHLKLL
jgi:PTH2 family peptidyl-tRNA hydrolase